jgi:hypothetical protein
MDLSRAAEQQQALDEATAAQAQGDEDLAAATAADHDGEEEQQQENGHAELEQQATGPIIEQQYAHQVGDISSDRGAPAAAVVPAFELQQGRQGEGQQQAAGAVELTATGAASGDPAAAALGESFEHMQQAWGGALDADTEAVVEEDFSPLDDADVGLAGVLASAAAAAAAAAAADDDDDDDDDDDNALAKLAAADNRGMLDALPQLYTQTAAAAAACDEQQLARHTATKNAAAGLTIHAGGDLAGAAAAAAAAIGNGNGVASMALCVDGGRGDTGGSQISTCVCVFTCVYVCVYVCVA